MFYAPCYVFYREAVIPTMSFTCPLEVLYLSVGGAILRPIQKNILTPTQNRLSKPQQNRQAKTPKTTPTKDGTIPVLFGSPLGSDTVLYPTFAPKAEQQQCLY